MLKNKSMGIGKTLVSISIILLLTVSSSSGAIDTTKIGIEKGDVFNYKLNVFTDEFENKSEVCVYCPDSGTDIKVSVGEEYSVEITDIEGNNATSIYKKGDIEIETYNILDERTSTDFLYTDWEYWPGSIADDWAWVLEAAADPLVFFDDLEYLEDFETNIIHQVEGDVFNTFFEHIWRYNSSDEVKEFSRIQHIEYDLETGAISLMIFNWTRTDWDGTIKKYHEEFELLSMSEGGFLPVNYSWFLVGFVILVIPKQIKKRRE